MTRREYPAYPSARATVEAWRYTAAAEALEGIPLVFLDGSTILLPESEKGAIDLLCSQFDAEIEYDCGQEWGFATNSRATGVPERLVRLGNAVWDVTGQSVAGMIQAALDFPDATYADWSALYLASTETH